MIRKINVILITVDSLRPDHLGFMGYKKDISPNIDALAKEGCIFTKAFATGPITPHSFPSIFTSTYPLDYHGPGKIERPRKLISEILKEQGFITAAFHSNPFLSEFFGYNKGWDVFEEKGIKIEDSFFQGKWRKAGRLLFKKINMFFSPHLFLFFSYLKRKKEKGTALKIKGSYLTQLAKDFISSLKSKKPFFLWLHYMDVHTPYILPEKLEEKTFSFQEYIASSALSFLPQYPNSRLRKIAKKYLELALELYDENIKYVDRQIGDFVDFLKEKNLYENSIIVLCADHGEEFLEHQGGSHWFSLYNELLHIPFIMKIPTFFSRTIERPVSTIDFAPTICDILQIERAPSFKGKNLFISSHSPIFHQTGVKEKPNIFSSRVEVIRACEIDNLNQCKMACQFKKWKYIIDFRENKEELYNLKKDPKEQNNLVKKESGKLSKMRKLIKEFQKENPPLSLLK